MLGIFQGMTRNSLNHMDRLTFDRYDTNGDGVISAAEFGNYVAVNGVGKVNGAQKKDEKVNKGFNLEQFDPQGAINFESNGGFNARKLNIIA